jgi:hypothetical protein
VTDRPSFLLGLRRAGFVMVAVSVSDGNIRTSELVAIERMVNHMPVFADYDVDRIARCRRP